MVFNIKSNKTVLGLLAPILELIESAKHQYSCHKLTDEEWLHCGIARSLEDDPSGRGFLQDIRAHTKKKFNIKRSHFFESLKSKRRLKHLQGINEAHLMHEAQASLKSATLKLPACLDNFHVYAGDGHFHAASRHDACDEKNNKHAVGHLYTLNLRTQLVSHLCLASDGHNKKPNDMGTLKRLEICALRQQAQTGQKVLYIWDRAGIDFQQWFKWKQGSGIYFLSRAKDNMIKEVIGVHKFDSKSSENAGVLKDEEIATSCSVSVRMVTYKDHARGEIFEFITNLGHNIAPGVIAQLYRMRWDIEKVFDEFKNKLCEKKAWGATNTAKRMQAQFIILSYNLMKLYQLKIEREESLVDEHAAQTRKKRTRALLKHYEALGESVPKWQIKLSRSTQIGVKFIRWLRAELFSTTPWELALELLEDSYAEK